MQGFHTTIADMHAPFATSGSFSQQRHVLAALQSSNLGRHLKHVRTAFLTFGSGPLLRNTGKGSRPELASRVSRIAQLPSSRK